MYRDLILDFISNNRLILNDNLVTRLTFVFFNEQDLDMIRFCGRDSEVSIYHVNEPYIYEKKYDLSKLMGTIIEVGLEDPRPLTLKYTDFSYDIKDPYYFKDLREQKFSSITLYPFFKNYKKDNQVLSGILLIYSDKDFIDISFANQKLLLLQKRIIGDENLQLMKEIENSIFENEMFEIVVKSKIIEMFYCNDNFKNNYHFLNNYIDKNSNNYQRIKKMVSSMHKKELSEYTIFYNTRKNKILEEVDVDFRTIDSINEHQFLSPISLIFLKSIDNTEDAKILVKKLTNIAYSFLPEANFKFYKIDDYTICQIIDKEISKSIKIEYKYQLKKRYFHIINIPKDLSIGVNFKSIIEYLQSQLPEEFKYDKFSSYLNQKNISKMNCDVINENSKKILIALFNQNQIGEVIVNPISNYYEIAPYKIFEETLIKKMELTIGEEHQAPIFSILISSLTKRKVQEVLKKIINKFSNTKLILHLPLLMEIKPEEVFELISKLKNMGFVIVVDSTIYMRLEYNTCMRLSDALIVRKDECKNSLLNGNPFNKALFSSYYNEGKVVIFESIPLEEDKELINELTCLIIER